VQSIPAYAALGVALIGVAVLLGWTFHIESLMSVFPGLIRMKVNTALSFLLAALALYLAHAQSYKKLQAFCAVMVAVVAVLTIAEYLYHLDAQIDQLLVHDPVQLTFPGRMAHLTAASFLLTALMLFPVRFPGSQKVRDLLALLLGFSSTFAVISFLYGVRLLYGASVYSAMAIHTGVGFLLLSLGFLFIPKPEGLVRIFQTDTSGGIVARWLIPPAILVPVLVGALFNRFNFGQLRLGIAFIVLSNILLIVAAVWSLGWVLDRSEMDRKVAEAASAVDGLTGIFNRRYFDRRLWEELQRCVRYSRNSCLLLFDIDHFKNVNDRFGHPAGDEVLRSIAGICERSLRTADVICRYGGEEFAVIAPETLGPEGIVLARKVRALVAGLTFEKMPSSLTVSVGVVEIPYALATSESIIAAADEALYTAKKLGRNRECLYTGNVLPDPQGLPLRKPTKRSPAENPALLATQRGNPR
jgi:diguanylate cyclase (GGDEF)-like protein